MCNKFHSILNNVELFQYHAFPTCCLFCLFDLGNSFTTWLHSWVVIKQAFLNETPITNWATMSFDQWDLLSILIFRHSVEWYWFMTWFLSNSSSCLFNISWVTVLIAICTVTYNSIKMILIKLLSLTLDSICEKMLKTLVSLVGKGSSNASKTALICSRVGLTAWKKYLQVDKKLEHTIISTLWAESSFTFFPSGKVKRRFWLLGTSFQSLH